MDAQDDGARAVASGRVLFGERLEHGGVRRRRSRGIGVVSRHSDDHRPRSGVHVERGLGEQGTLGVDRGALDGDARHDWRRRGALCRNVLVVRPEQELPSQHRHDHLDRDSLRRNSTHDAPSNVARRVPASERGGDAVLRLPVLLGVELRAFVVFLSTANLHRRQRRAQKTRERGHDGVHAGFRRVRRDTRG